MIRHKLRSLHLGVIALALLTVATSAWAARAFITVGTGSVTGVYYRAGGGVCALVNAGRADHQIRCTIASSPGSVANIDALRRGQRAFGLAQADLAAQAYSGTGAYADTDGFEGLRGVFALHAETVTVVAGPNSGISELQDLRDQRVNIGPAGSGQRASMQALMNALGWTAADFANAAEMDPGVQAQALCDGELDAGVFITGHPNGSVKRALDCGGQIVPVQGPAINRLVRGADYYTTTAIPPSAYAGVSSEVPTYGVTALFVSSTNTPRNIVLEVTQAVFDNVGQFKTWHEGLSGLNKAGMARGTEAVDAPRHPGAQLFYEDNGLL